MRLNLIASVVVSALIAGGCTRVQTGEVGLRVGFDKQVNLTELQPGTFNQTVVGDVLLFPVRDISLKLENMTPQTADNSSLEDFDLMVVYSINPANVGEIYTTKSRGFHLHDEHGEIFLMYNYIEGIARSAAYKAVRKHEALKVADSRTEIEAETMEYIRAALREEKLDAAVLLTQVQVRNVQPARSIIESANQALRAQNDLKTKLIEVQTAKAEAEKQAALANVGEKSIALMRVQNEKIIAEAIANGKVQTIIVPANFTMLGAVK